MPNRTSTIWPRLYRDLPLILLAAAYLFPLGDLPWPTFTKELIAAGSLAILTSQLVRKSNHYPVCLNKMDFGIEGVLLLGIALTPILHLLIMKGDYTADSIIASIYLIGLALAVQAGRAMASGNGEGSIRLLTLIAVVGALLAIQALLQLIFPSGLSSMLSSSTQGRLSANFGQPNHLATALVAGILAYIFVCQAFRLPPWLEYTVLFVQIMALWGTRSRTGLLSGALVLIAAIIISCNSKFRLTPRKYAIYCAMLCLAPLTFELLLNTSDGGARFGTASAEVRLNQWKLAIAAISDNPILGYGWNGIPRAQYSHSNDFVSIPFFEYTHNIILDLLIWNGVPLACAFLSAIALLLWRAVRNAKTPAQLVLAGSLIPVVVHSNLEFPHAFFYFILQFGLTIGCLIGYEQDENRKRYRRALINAYAASAAATIVALTLVAIDYRRLLPSSQLMRYSFMNESSNKAEVPTTLLIDHQRDLIIFMSSSYTDYPNYSQARQFSVRVASRFGYWPVLFHASEIAFQFGDLRSSSDWLDKACRMSWPNECEAARKRFVRTVAIENAN